MVTNGVKYLLTTVICRAYFETESSYKIINFQIKMFFRIRPFLIISYFQNVRHSHHSHSTGLVNYLMSIKESPPKASYSNLFFDKNVQDLLKKISNIDLEKVFEPKSLGEKFDTPVYELMTTEDLKEAMLKAEKTAEYLLQIPPLLNIKEEEPEILDSDTSLDGYDQQHSKHVFIDISFDGTNEERVIVVREPNGILRRALRSERFRANQIYFPLPGRELETPKMFETENLINVILNKNYEFILDRACAQFDPEDPSYHEVITLTYEAINHNRDFKMLHSTRHFGSLAFYLVSHQKIDNLLMDDLQNERLDNAISLVKVYHLIHPKCKSAELAQDSTDDLKSLKDFISFDSRNKDVLNRDLRFCLERKKEEENVRKGTEEDHAL